MVITLKNLRIWSTVKVSWVRRCSRNSPASKLEAEVIRMASVSILGKHLCVFISAPSPFLAQFISIFHTHTCTYSLKCTVVLFYIINRIICSNNKSLLAYSSYMYIVHSLQVFRYIVVSDRPLEMH